MLIVSKYGEIKLTRGDTAYLIVTPTIGKGEEKQPYTVKNDDVLIFTVKEDYDDEAVIKKEITGSTTFHIKPEDTKGLAFGKYKYDVQLRPPDGENYTFIADKVFEITKEVG